MNFLKCVCVYVYTCECKGVMALISTEKTRNVTTQPKESKIGTYGFEAFINHCTLIVLPYTCILYMSLEMLLYVRTGSQQGMLESLWIFNDKNYTV